MYIGVSQEIARLSLVRAVPPGYLFMCETGWIAWTAIGTSALAVATFAAIAVTVRTARTDRQRDDAKRADERKRDDLLRHEAAGERDQRDAAERAGHGRTTRLVRSWSPSRPKSTLARATTSTGGSR